MAWSRAEDEVRQFLERTQIPFLRSPMRKVSPPAIDYRLSPAAARTLALQNTCGQFELASDIGQKPLVTLPKCSF